MKKGILYAIGAYALWGFFPIYWKLLEKIPALQLLSHRIIWSFVTLLIIIFILRRGKEFLSGIFKKRVLLIYTCAVLVICINWFIYVWAVNAGYIVETSLGYFINPLVSILLGMIFLRERLRPLQWLPVGIAQACFT